MFFVALDCSNTAITLSIGIACLVFPFIPFTVSALNIEFIIASFVLSTTPLNKLLKLSSDNWFTLYLLSPDSILLYSEFENAITKSPLLCEAIPPASPNPIPALFANLLSCLLDKGASVAITIIIDPGGSLESF